jgi:anti-sigma-K factor RskA
MNREPMSHDDALDLAGGYVLGALEPAEMAAVRDHLATCSLPHPEFDDLGGVVAALLEDVQHVEPPAALRDRIMDAARADLAERGAPSQAAAAPPVAAPAVPPTPAPTTFPSAVEREARRARTRGLDWALRIAAVIAVVAIGAWGLGLQRQLDAANRFERSVAGVLDAAGKPGARAVILTPAEGKQGTGIAAVAADGTVTLAMRDLPATNGSQVYTAWVIVGKNAPVSLGDFTVDSNGIASVTTRPAPTPQGAIIALTLEPNAGNTAPQGPIISTGIAPGAIG